MILRKWPPAIAIPFALAASITRAQAVGVPDFNIANAIPNALSYSSGAQATIQPVILVNPNNKSPCLPGNTGCAALPVSDTTPAADVIAQGSITVRDTGSTTATGQNSVTIYGGTPTTGSWVGAGNALGTSSAITAVPLIGVEVLGTWTGTLQVRCAGDTPAATFVALINGTQEGFSTSDPGTIASITANGKFHFKASTCTGFYVAASAAITGTATIYITKTANP